MTYPSLAREPDRLIEEFAARYGLSPAEARFVAQNAGYKSEGLEPALRRLREQQAA